MTSTYNVLIIEDEPLIVGVLNSALEQVEEAMPELDFRISSATDCDEALYEVRKAVKARPIDLVILDINLPGSHDKKVLCGEDLGSEIRSFFPEVKIMVMTSQNNNYRLNNILRSLNPEGFIVKTEIDFSNLVSALTTVIEDSPFYTKAILQLMRRHVVNEFTLDSIDRQLLYQLSRGAKTKDLVKSIGLSKSAIDLRKRNLKDVFGIDKGGDQKLINRAERHGFI